MVYYTLSFLILRGTLNVKHCPKVFEYLPIICCTNSESVSNITCVALILPYSKKQVLPVLILKFYVGGEFIRNWEHNLPLE